MHWRSSARAGKLVVKQQVSGAPNHTVIVLDTDASAYSSDDQFGSSWVAERFEAAVEVAASFAVAHAHRAEQLYVVTTSRGASVTTAAAGAAGRVPRCVRGGERSATGRHGAGADCTARPADALPPADADHGYARTTHSGGDAHGRADHVLPDDRPRRVWAARAAARSTRARRRRHRGSGGSAVTRGQQLAVTITCLVASVTYAGAVTTWAMGLFVLPGVAVAALLASLLAARRMSGMAIGVVGALVLGWAELANIWTGTANGPAARSTAFAAGWTVIAVVLAHSRWPALFLAGVAGVVAGAVVLGAAGEVRIVVVAAAVCAALTLGWIERSRRNWTAPPRRGIALVLLSLLAGSGRRRSRAAAGAGGSERPCAGHTKAGSTLESSRPGPTRSATLRIRSAGPPPDTARTPRRTGETPPEGSIHLATPRSQLRSTQPGRILPRSRSTRHGRSGSTWSPRSCWSCSSSPC